MNAQSKARHAELERRRRRRLAGKLPLSAPPWHEVCQRHEGIAAVIRRFPGEGPATWARRAGCSRPLIYKILAGKGRVKP